MEDFFNYIQIFFLMVFLLFIIGKTIHLQKKIKINPISIHFRSRERFRDLMELFLLLIVTIWSFEVIFYALDTGFRLFGRPFNIRLFDNLGLRALGLFFVFSGFVFFIWALINLGTSWRLGIDEKKPGRLIKNGIYQYSRHPIYVFFNLYFLGTFLIWGHLIFLIFWVAVAAILQYKIVEEEKFLSRLFKQEYIHYMEDVGRYISLKPSNYKKAESPKQAETES